MNVVEGYKSYLIPNVSNWRCLQECLPGVSELIIQLFELVGEGDVLLYLAPYNVP